MSEYNRLADEINMRLNVMQTNNSAVITIILTLWTLLVTGIGYFITTNVDIIEAVLATGDEMQLEVILLFFAGYAVIFLFLVPLAILCPLAAKERDNLFQIFHIGKYMELFYEDKCGFHWEHLQEGARAYRQNAWDRGELNKEYSNLAFINCVLYVICCTMIGLFCWKLNLFGKYPLFVIVLAVWILAVGGILLYFTFIIKDSADLEKIISSIENLEEIYKEMLGVENTEHDETKKTDKKKLTKKK